MSDEPQIPADVMLGEWLRGEGLDADIALSTRVRFARNIRGYRFTPCQDDAEAEELDALLRRTVVEAVPEPRLKILDLPRLPVLERELLVERHLISRELAHAERSRSAAVDAGESVSIMINEEDHLRSQVFRSGRAVPAAYAAAEALDDALLQRLPAAFSEELGFLTSCPTNVGTGLRVSVMLHLPGLVWSEEIETAAHTAQKIHLTVRGLYGEGSRALGHFYQLSNQVTLGRAESQIRDDVETAVESFVDWERRVREALLSGRKRARTLDRIARALAVLQSATMLTSEECLDNLSAVRFGLHAKRIVGIDVHDLDRVLLVTQPAHLQQLCGERLEPAERDQRRAGLVRSVLGAAEIVPA